MDVRVFITILEICLKKEKKNSSIKTFLIHLECQTAMGEIEVRDSEPKQKPVYIHYWQAVISRVID